MKSAIWVVGLVMFLSLSGTGQARDLLPCAERSTHQDPPWVSLDWCLEVVIKDKQAGELAFSALAVGPDGTLYATRPHTGEILALTDTDGDALPDSPQVIADDLSLPNGLVWHDGALYISGGTRLDRWRDNQLVTLVNDLPSGSGLWTGRLTIGPDERLYVGSGAPCDWCERTAPGRAIIWSYALDGSDPQVIATGIREPMDVAFLGGYLWSVDTAPDQTTEVDGDRLLQIEPGAFYGWPECPENGDCTNLPSAALTFPTHSHPVGLEAYTSATFPSIQNHLLVVLNGSRGTAALEGYTLVAVPIQSDGSASDYRIIVPESATTEFAVPLLRMHYVKSGFWPLRPLDVAVSPEGWIYISVSGGSIYALRPR